MRSKAGTVFSMTRLSVLNQSVAPYFSPIACSMQRDAPAMQGDVSLHAGSPGHRPGLLRTAIYALNGLIAADRLTGVAGQFGADLRIRIGPEFVDDIVRDLHLHLYCVSGLLMRSLCESRSREHRNAERRQNQLGVERFHFSYPVSTSPLALEYGRFGIAQGVLWSSQNHKIMMRINMLIHILLASLRLTLRCKRDWEQSSKPRRIGATNFPSGGLGDSFSCLARRWESSAATGGIKSPYLPRGTSGDRNDKG
jgi:hypothetical protein